jgi:hypothetical protein
MIQPALVAFGNPRKVFYNADNTADGIRQLIDLLPNTVHVMAEQFEVHSERFVARGQGFQPFVNVHLPSILSDAS